MSEDEFPNYSYMSSDYILYVKPLSSTDIEPNYL